MSIKIQIWMKPNALEVHDADANRSLP